MFDLCLDILKFIILCLSALALSI